MSGYVLKRLASIIVLAFGVTLLVFLIIRLIPGDPAVVMLGTNAGDAALIERLHQLHAERPHRMLTQSRRSFKKKSMQQPGCSGS